jgi:hypothetical protein
MSKLEMISIGNNLDGDPVYQIGTRGDDGSMTLVKTTIMTEAEAIAAISGDVKAEVVEEAEIIEEAVDVDSMTKVQLEAYMREHNIELDRRKSKKDLLAQVKAFFKE